MKYICRFIADNPNKKSCNEWSTTNCRHSEPHEWRTVRGNSCCFNYLNKDTECDCVPVPLEYWMRKIIKEHEEINEMY